MTLVIVRRSDLVNPSPALPVVLTLGADLQRLVGLHQRLLQLGEASLQSLGLLLVGLQLLLQLLPPPAEQCQVVTSSASKSSIRRFVITEKAPTRAFSLLKAATTAFTFKTL